MNQATTLQVALGVLLRDSKAIVNSMYDYRVTCSYDELLCFKKSAAVAATVDPNQQGISDARRGLIQIVADNFDCDISSPNGKLSTHSLAMIITQPGCRDDTSSKDDIKRLKKDELLQPIDDGHDENFVQYYGKKKPIMPTVPITVQDCKRVTMKS